MKKIITILLILVVFISTSSFTTKQLPGVHNCEYKMYSKDGTFLGYWDIWVPGDVSCSSGKAKALAVADYNVWN